MTAPNHKSIKPLTTEGVFTISEKESVKNQISAFNKEYGKLKNTQNNCLLIKIKIALAGVGFIHCVCWVRTLKIFKDQHSLGISRFVEITALITSTGGFLLILTSLLYINRKQAELYISSGDIIAKLEKELKSLKTPAPSEANLSSDEGLGNPGVINNANNINVNNTDGGKDLERPLSSSSESSAVTEVSELSENEPLIINKKAYDSKDAAKQLNLREITIEAELERLKKIRETLERDTAKQRLGSYLGLGASSIFVVMEILAVAQLYKDFGMDKWHGSLPINFQGIVDSVAIALLVGASFLALSSALEKEKAKSGRQDDGKEHKSKEWHQNPAIIVPLIACGAAMLNLLGKILQGMEAAKAFNVPLGGGRDLAVGFTIRIVACLIGLGTLIYALKGVMDKSLDSDLKIEALRHTENYVQPEV